MSVLLNRVAKPVVKFGVRSWPLMSTLSSSIGLEASTETVTPEALVETNAEEALEAGRMSRGTTVKSALKLWMRCATRSGLLFWLMALIVIVYVPAASVNPEGVSL